MLIKDYAMLYVTQSEAIGITQCLILFYRSTVFRIHYNSAKE